MSGQNTSDWVLGAVKKNPEGLLLLAAGAVLLMRKSGGGAGNGQRRSGNSRDSGMTKAAGEAKGYAADIADRAKKTVDSVASSASDYADEATRTVSAQSARVFEQAQSTFQGTKDRVLKDQPLVVAVAGLAAGAAIAAAFPATDREKSTLGPIGDQVSEAAGRIGEQLKEATAQAGETLKKAADERGLNADGLQKVASEVAGAFSGSMTGGSGQGGSQPSQSNRSGNTQ
jgi:ElaB/YqjD/DUF883 family membrane-anchored ribosome-binding protein